uniref:PAM2 domain-containing protein n=1 Tax=Heterorhabditis bacteriophora TaxID=37862 RepID=A0A1I7WK14_HETBA
MAAHQIGIPQYQSVPYMPHYSHSQNNIVNHQFTALNGTKSPEVGTIPDGNAAVVPKVEISTTPAEEKFLWSGSTPATAPPHLGRHLDVNNKIDKDRQLCNVENVKFQDILPLDQVSQYNLLKIMHNVLYLFSF